MYADHLIELVACSLLFWEMNNQGEKKIFFKFFYFQDFECPESEVTLSKEILTLGWNKMDYSYTTYFW